MLNPAPAGSDSDSGSDAEGVSRHLVELIALIMLPLGMFMCVYALYIFTWRAHNIAKKKVCVCPFSVCLCISIVA